MADYYRELLAGETEYLTNQIEKFDKILEENAEQISESVIGQIRLAIGQSNLFINERFKQFAGLIDDCELKRGEKETKVEDLAGFWDMIYYQVEDLKVKYGQLEYMQRNNWVAVEVIPVPVKSSLKTMQDNKANIVKNKRAVPSKTSPPLKNGSSENGISTTDGVAVKKPAVRSNFREFLKNKKKEANGAPEPVTNGSSATNGNSTVPSTNGHANGLSNGTHLHLNGNSKHTGESVNGATTNGHHLNGESLESQKLKALTETMSRHSLTTPTLIDETNKEN